MQITTQYIDKALNLPGKSAPGARPQLPSLLSPNDLTFSKEKTVPVRSPELTDVRPQSLPPTPPV